MFRPRHDPTVYQLVYQQFCIGLSQIWSEQSRKKAAQNIELQYVIWMALERYGTIVWRTPSPPTLTSGIRRRAGSGNLCANEQLLGELPTFRRSPSHAVSASRAILRYGKKEKWACNSIL